MTRDLYPGLAPMVAAASFALLFLKYGRRGAWRQVGFGLAGLVGGPQWQAGQAGLDRRLSLVAKTGKYRNGGE